MYVLSTGSGALGPNGIRETPNSRPQFPYFFLLFAF